MGIEESPESTSLEKLNLGLDRRHHFQTMDSGAAVWLLSLLSNSGPNSYSHGIANEVMKLGFAGHVFYGSREDLFRKRQFVPSKLAGSFCLMLKNWSILVPGS